MVIGDDKLHAVQPARLQPLDEGGPTRARFPIRELHAEELATALPVDADGQKHGLGLDHLVEPDFLVAGIEDDIRIGFVEPPWGKPA